LSIAPDKSAMSWSRRRAAVKAEAEAEVRALADVEMAREQARLDAKPDAEILQELQLPDPDSLQQGDDFSGFLKSAVPERLRRRALHRLWRLSPDFNFVDDLLEYGEDFKNEGAVIGALQTAYQVGKGMLAHVEEMAKADAAAEDGQDAPDAQVAAHSSQEEPASDSTPEASAQPELSGPEAAFAASETDQNEKADFAPRRRMRFEFAS
jgi:Protein of unknown function (DUF3306)